MITKPTYSPGLIAILAHHREAGSISVKELAHVTDKSYSTAERIVEHGWEAFEAIQRLVAKVNLPLAMDIAAELLGKRFAITVREEITGAPGVMGALQVIKTSASLAVEIERADGDGVRTAEEAARINRGINDIRADLDRLEAENRSRTSRRTA